MSSHPTPNMQDWEMFVLEERQLSKASKVMLAPFPAHLDSCTVPSPSLSPSISFKASALAEGRRERGSQWR